MSYIIAILTMLCASAAAPADDSAPAPWYQVEVVIFEHDDTGDTETWPADPGAPDATHAVALLPPLDAAAVPQAAGTAADAPAAAAVPPSSATAAAPPAAAADSPAFHLLPGPDLQLNDTVDKLDGTPGYRVLFHAAWRQPVYDPDHTQPVHVEVNPLSEAPMDQALPPPADGTSPVAPEAAAAPVADPAAAGAPPQPAPQPVTPAWLLDGTMTLAQSRYLHLDVDMLFEQRVTQAGAEGAAPQTPGASLVDSDTLQGFRMQQSRRVNSGKLYYFDHPRFGVLAQISPYQPPPSPAADPAAARQPAAH